MIRIHPTLLTFLTDEEGNLHIAILFVLLAVAHGARNALTDHAHFKLCQALFEAPAIADDAFREHLLTAAHGRKIGPHALAEGVIVGQRFPGEQPIAGMQPMRARISAARAAPAALRGPVLLAALLLFGQQLADSSHRGLLLPYKQMYVCISWEDYSEWVFGCQRGVGSGKWLVVSGEWLVVSGEWLVVSG